MTDPLVWGAVGTAYVAARGLQALIRHHTPPDQRRAAKPSLISRWFRAAVTPGVQRPVRSHMQERRKKP